MHKKKWTPWDSELLLMVERLTGNKPVISREEKDCYEFQIDLGEYAGDPAYEEAVFRAIKGRAGERYVKQVGGTFAGVFYVTIRFSEKAVPGLATRMDAGVDLEAAIEYIPAGCSVFAVKFDPELPAPALSFVGGGEIEQEGDGPVLVFDSGAGVFRRACSGEYIVFDNTGLLSVVPEDEFEAKYVPR